MLVYGVVHLQSLPGSPSNRISLDEIIDHAQEDVNNLIFGGVDGSNVLQGTNPSDGRAYDGVSTANENALDVSFFVLRIPCAFGYMNSTYFG